MLSTFQQCVAGLRKRKIKKKQGKALERCPQKRGIVRRLLIRTPRKPNSAKRKIARVWLPSNLRRIYAYIPGIGQNNLIEHSVVLVRGGRVRDLPGVLYHIIRGGKKSDLKVLENRRTARSKYGTKKGR